MEIGITTFKFVMVQFPSIARSMEEESLAIQYQNVYQIYIDLTLVSYKCYRNSESLFKQYVRGWTVTDNQKRMLCRFLFYFILNQNIRKSFINDIIKQNIL